MVAGKLFDGVFHNGVHLGGRVVLEECEDDCGAFLTVTEYAQEGDNRQQGREDGQHGEVSERCRHVACAVCTECEDSTAQDVEDAALREVTQFHACVLGGCGLLLTGEESASSSGGYLS